MGTPRRRLLALVLAAWGVVGPPGLSGPTSAGEWAQADRPREWSFPRDHGAHPAYATEWWYFTGNLRDASARRYGYQLTIFRVGLRREAADPTNPWSVRDVYLGHFALTEVERGRFRYDDCASRTGPGLAGASTEDLDVWVLDWRSVRDGGGGAIRLHARTRRMAIDLALTPRKPVVLHGDGGRSRKGPRPSQASYYASLTDLATEGRIRTEAGGEGVPVTGTSWFDHEFGSNQLAADQQGWDWFSLHLSDGRDLMLYRLRRTDGTTEPASSGTLVGPDGTARHLPREAFVAEPLDHWTSPRTGARYPTRWRVRVPSAGIDLTVAALVPDQKLVTENSTKIIY